MRRDTFVVALLGLFCMLSGCLAPVSVEDLAVESERFVLPEGDYLDIAWWRTDQFAASYGEWPDELPNDWPDDLLYSPYLFEYEYLLLDLVDSSEISSSVLTVPQPYTGCRAVWKMDVERLADGRLGATRECIFELRGFSASYEEIVAYERERGTFDVLYRAPHMENISSFSYSPDMSSSLQTFDKSGGLVPEMYLADANWEATPLFGAFKRARHGSFSPTGKAFAFFGNESVREVGWYPEIWNIAAQQAQPWNLYVMELPDGELRSLLQVRGGRHAKWSPAGAYVAFRGNVHGADGVWVVHVDTHDTYRVWQESTPFDWSPDGTRIAVVEQESHGNERAPSVTLVLLSLPLRP